MVFYDYELEDCVDLFENDECVLTKYFFKAEHFYIEKLAVGIKAENGDIESIVFVNEKVK